MACPKGTVYICGMRNNDATTEEEWGFAKRALRRLTGFDSWHLAKSEAPDFIVTHADVRFGLEVRRIFRGEGVDGSLIRTEETLRQRVLTRAKQIHDASGLPPVSVSVFFDSSHPLVYADREALSSALAQLVLKNMPDVGGTCQEEYDGINRSWFPDYFQLIRVHRFREAVTSSWGAPAADYVEALQPEHINWAISKKESRLDKYKQQVWPVWLLLVVEHSGLSSWFKSVESALTGTYSTRFERLLLLQWTSDRIHELPVE